MCAQMNYLYINVIINEYTSLS